MKLTEEDISVIIPSNRFPIHQSGLAFHKHFDTFEEAQQAKQQILSNQEKAEKLTEEYQATKDLVSEGDPFTMTRAEYLDILRTLMGEKS